MQGYRQDASRCAAPDIQLLFILHEPKSVQQVGKQRCRNCASLAGNTTDYRANENKALYDAPASLACVVITLLVYLARESRGASSIARKSTSLPTNRCSVQKSPFTFRSYAKILRIVRERNLVPKSSRKRVFDRRRMIERPRNLLPLRRFISGVRVPTNHVRPWYSCSTVRIDEPQRLGFHRCVGAHSSIVDRLRVSSD